MDTIDKRVGNIEILIGVLELELREIKNFLNEQYPIQVEQVEGGSKEKPPSRFEVDRRR